MRYDGPAIGDESVSLRPYLPEHDDLLADLILAGRWTMEDSLPDDVQGWVRAQAEDGASLFLAGYDHEDLAGFLWFTRVRVGRDALINGSGTRRGKPRWALEGTAQAVRLALDLARQIFGVKVIRADICERNRAVAHVMMLAGMTRVSRLSQHRYYEGRAYDSLLFEIVMGGAHV